MQPETKICQNCKNSFTIEPDDFLFYEKMKVPPPTWCPECRLKRRMVWRNERNLYRVKDAVSGQEVFSGIPPQAPVKVYDHDFWWSDGWDPMEYGREYDFSRPFFEQFLKLMQNVPFPSRNIQNLINSDYSDQGGDLKNCYLCFNSGKVEDSAYILNANLVKDSFDLNDASSVEISYASLGIGESYKVFFSFYCDRSNNLWFSQNCVGCSFCFGCINLRNKQYHIFNKPYAAEDYFEEVKKFNLNSYGGLSKAYEEARKFWDSRPRKFIHGYQNTDSSGENIYFSKNVKFSFGIESGEDLKYCQEIYRQAGYWEGGKDSYDHYNWGYGTELMYEVCGSGRGCKNVRFCLDCWPAVQDLEYSMRCGSSNNLFGCLGLRKKSYCILNKQYAPEEYFALRERIIRHMNEMPYVDKQGRVYKYGEFFPIEFSLFAYNETVAGDYFPLAKEESEKLGYVWRDTEPREYQTTIDANDLPDRIGDATEDVLKEVIRCLSCKRAYRIIPSEFNFLKAQSIPLPRLCFNCRYLRRFSFRNKPKYYERKCQCAGNSSERKIYQNQTTHFHKNLPCPNEFETSYAPDRQEIVYCESCYQAEVA